jgi:hypothetical protein
MQVSTQTCLCPLRLIGKPRNVPKDTRDPCVGFLILTTNTKCSRYKADKGTICLSSKPIKMICYPELAYIYYYKYLQCEAHRNEIDAALTPIPTNKNGNHSIPQARARDVHRRTCRQCPVHQTQRLPHKHPVSPHRHPHPTERPATQRRERPQTLRQHPQINAGCNLVAPKPRRMDLLLHQNGQRVRPGRGRHRIRAE